MYKRPTRFGSDLVVFDHFVGLALKGLNRTKYSRMYQVKFVEDSLYQTIALQIFKGCLPPISLGKFLNILLQILSQPVGKLPDLPKLSQHMAQS